MRGRLRVVDGDTVTWREVPMEYWQEKLDDGTDGYNGTDVPTIEAPTLPVGSETPNYREESNWFTIKVHHDGAFDEKLENYVGGLISYFDNCSLKKLNLFDVESMLSELGLLKGSYDIWFCIPGADINRGLCQIASTDDVDTMANLIVYTHCFDVYTTKRLVSDGYYEDFSFTQFLLDEREERVGDIMEEFEVKKTFNDEGEVDEGRHEDEDKISFQGDSSNMESSEIEVEVPKKRKRRIPPPNPPYRTRKKGRYSMLRGLFKNTEDNPVVLDDDNGPPSSQPTQDDSVQDNCRKRKTVEGKKKKVPEKEVSVEQSIVDKGAENRDGQNRGGKKKGGKDGQKNAGQKMVGGKKVGQKKRDQTVGQKKNYQSPDDDASSEGMFDSDDERMAVSSCDEDEIQFPEFNETTDMKNPQFAIGMLFTSGKVFRDAVRQHAILNQRPIKLKKNLSDKIKWVCTEGCKWKCYGIKQKTTDTIQIKTLYSQHSCNPTWEQKQVNSTWIANLYEDDIRMNPNWPATAFQAKVTNDLKCKISMSMIYRALQKAKENIYGKHAAQYAKLWTYANEVKKQMPTSTVKLMSEAAEAGVDGRRFKRLYVCLGPLKEGFLEGCRPLIGLDGCHLKGPLGGILLTAVGTDPNDGMYPLAWAQVEAENNDSWDWFLGLKDDLRIDNTGSYTFISDRQKGLVNALENQVPNAEHRFCVMHLYKNMYKEHKGIGVRRLLWCAAKATTDYHFNKHMTDLKKVAPRAYDWLAAKPRSQWSRSSFRELCKSDMFVNNNCEIFNNAINKFRDMAIITMFKNIHITCMERIQRRKRKMEKKNTLYCTNAMKRLQKAMENACQARPIWNGGHKYHVTMTEGGYEIFVDLQKRECACRKWQLTGIPCFHACSCIFFQKQDPVDYMHECHKKEWYLRVYSHYIEPINGEEFWEETEATPLLPPLFKVGPGRPKKKRDNKSDILQTRATDPTMLKRVGTTVHCAYCKAAGHNSRSCKSKEIDEKITSSHHGKKPVICSYCKGTNHNARTCHKKKAEGQTAEQQPASSSKEPVEQQKEIVAEKISKTPSPNKSVKKPATTTHGGILHPFKAPAQQTLGIDGVKGQKYTSLKKLDAARLKMQKNLGKKK